MSIFPNYSNSLFVLLIYSPNLVPLIILKMPSSKTLRQRQRNNSHYIQLWGGTCRPPCRAHPVTPGRAGPGAAGHPQRGLIFYLEHPVKCPFILLHETSKLRVCSFECYGISHTCPAHQLHSVPASLPMPRRTHPLPSAPAAPPGHSRQADPCSSHFSSEI